MTGKKGKASGMCGRFLPEGQGCPTHDPNWAKEVVYGADSEPRRCPKCGNYIPSDGTPIEERDPAFECVCGHEEKVRE